MRGLKISFIKPYCMGHTYCVPRVNVAEKPADLSLIPYPCP